MRKRILLLFILLFLLTAFSPVNQNTADSELFSEETAMDTVAPEDIAGTEIMSQDPETDEVKNMDTAETSGPDEKSPGVCDQYAEKCGVVPADEENEESSIDPDIKGAADTDEAGDTGAGTEDEKIAEENGDSSATDVSWHMTFSVDCVSAGCIALTDSTAGMYVSACNDGEGEYRNVDFTPVDQAGRFVSYFVTEGSHPDFGSRDTVLISNMPSTFSYGPLPADRCVTAVFESEITPPPADYTEYKRFEFRLAADNGETVQTASAYADKYGCYVPVNNSGVSLSVSQFDGCIDPGSRTAEYELRIENTGGADLCRITIGADSPGSFIRIRLCPHLSHFIFPVKQQVFKDLLANGPSSFLRFISAWT